MFEDLVNIDKIVNVKIKEEVIEIIKSVDYIKYMN